MPAATRATLQQSGDIDGRHLVIITGIRELPDGRKVLITKRVGKTTLIDSESFCRFVNPQKVLHSEPGRLGANN